ncbi:hypothetical protein Pan110_50380 [Gimesia panareensis]|nr:hypothetical protein Pan110_50380 [Gimesia panareensis]
MSSCFSNRAETRGFYGVFVSSVLIVPVKKLVARARRITRHSGQTQVRVQSSLFSSQGGFVKWEMIIPKALSGKPINGTQTVSMRGRITEPFVLFLCQFPARGARPVRASALLGKPREACP